MSTPTVPTSGLGIDFPNRRQRFIARTVFVAGLPVQFDTSLANIDSDNLEPGDTASGLVNGVYPQAAGSASGRLFGVATDGIGDNQKGYADVSGIVSMYLSGTGSAGDPVTVGVQQNGSRIVGIALEAWSAAGRVRCLFDGCHGFGTHLESEPEDYPVVTITSPEDGAEFMAGETITFTATATDATDGDVSSSLDWVSSADGTLATNDASFTDATLTVGLHTITATAQDSGANEGSDSVNIVVINSNGQHEPPVGGGPGGGAVIS